MGTILNIYRKHPIREKKTMKMTYTALLLIIGLFFTSQANALVFSGTFTGYQNGTLNYYCDVNYSIFENKLTTVCDGIYENYSNIPGFSLNGQMSFSLETSNYITTVAFQGGPIEINTPKGNYINSFDNLAFYMDGPQEEWSITGGYTINDEYIKVNNDLEALAMFGMFLF